MSQILYICPRFYHLFKKSNKCRFNFPRFPCRETLIVKPFSEDPDDLEGTKARKDKCEKIIERVKTALENVDDENITFGRNRTLSQQKDIPAEPSTNAAIVEKNPKGNDPN